MARNKGFERVNDSPVAVPVEFKRAVGEVDRMRSMMANLVRDLRDRDDVESLEESLDFDVDEDQDMEDDVSQSELRYMTEEKLLTEKEEAARVMLQRREAAKLRERFDYGKDRDRRERGDERGVDVSAKRVDSERKERAAVSGEGRSAAVSLGGVSKGDEKAG